MTRQLILGAVAGFAIAVGVLWVMGRRSDTPTPTPGPPPPAQTHPPQPLQLNRLERLNLARANPVAVQPVDLKAQLQVGTDGAADASVP
jgi:hypothetical protein